MIHRPIRLTLLPAILAGLLAVAPTTFAGAADLAAVQAQGDSVVFHSLAADARLYLTVTGPAGFAFERRFTGGEAPDLRTESLADGLYRWQLLRELAPGAASPSRSDRDRLDSSSDPAQVQSGYFTVRDGVVVSPGPEQILEESAGATAALRDGLSHLTAADQVILDDLIVLGRACVGTSCVNNENFGSDDLRLKEVNLRIHFQDTSTGSFPTRDWRITVNEGTDRFSIDDVDGSTTPFTLEAGAPANALYLDSTGRLGLGTATPQEEIHSAVGDSPGIRLEQNGSMGFTPQTWEIAGNEANFFVEDVTNGSQYPFRIRPDAPTDSLHIAADGDVGLGTAAIPTDVRLLVQAATSANFGGLRVKNTGTGNIQTQFAGNTWEWRQTFRSGDLIFDSQEDGANELVLTTGGVLTVTSLVQTSDRALKENFESVDPGDILERLASIPIQRWSFKGDEAATPHLGPMAQDFHAAFGLGADDQHIAATDADGVALTAIQALYRRLQQKEAAVDELRARLEAQERALGELLRTVEAMEP